MYQQPTGTRFGADAMYNGDNREGGAMLSFVVNAPESEEKEENKKDEKEDEDKVSYDSLTLEIYNTSGDLIRTLKQKAPKEKGINRMYWRLDEKGV